MKVEVESLVKDFGPLRVIDDLSFSVSEGEVLGFLGPNGAGKSTTMKMITGFLPPTAGDASVCGHSIIQEPLQAKRILGYLPEGAPAYGEMTPWQFLNFVADIRQLPMRRQRLDYVIGRLELEPVLYRPVDTLSKGFRRRVGLAQAVLHDPKVLIMDEPTDGLDPNQKRHVRELIREMAREKIIIVSTHILEEVDAICSRLIIISSGRILVDETPEKLRMRSRYYNAVTVSGALGEAACSDLEQLAGVSAVRREDNGGRTLLAVSGTTLVEPVRAVLQKHQCAEVQMYVHEGRMDDVFHTLTKGAHD